MYLNPTLLPQIRNYYDFCSMEEQYHIQLIIFANVFTQLKPSTIAIPINHLNVPIHYREKVNIIKTKQRRMPPSIPDYTTHYNKSSRYLAYYKITS